ncbi:unnamed protein product [Phytophthora fragariaefolia]|uniref:Unnamed protein product n=1 Tax=Phytophthora fragariaefolia TaxID=1490495 RepID=A0A9W6Y6U2_9STRA|nr:unnamed protein product [Phytophthora fragariaefolia]
MSYRSTRSWPGSQSKELTIPDHVPVGAVIGKGGSNCKALRDSHGVRCIVNGDDRKVTLKGPRNGIQGAEDELVELFSSFALAKSVPTRVFDVVARDGPSCWWSFEKEKNVSSDSQVQEYPYRLQQSGRAAVAASVNESWIKDFREDDADAIMNYLKEGPPYTMKIAFGKLCFQLKSVRCANSTIAWPELQKLRNFDDFTTRWSNFCDRTSPSMVALIDELEEWMEKGVDPQHVMSVHLAGLGATSYDLKYQLVDGQWELKKAYSRRYVLGTYDTIVDNDTSFRLRAVTRDKLPENAASDIQRYLAISIPSSGDFFGTEVAVSSSAPTKLHIKGFSAKVKVCVEANGLRFSIMYLDERQKEFRLECRLSKTAKEKLSSEDNEAQILLEKVLQVLSSGSGWATTYAAVAREGWKSAGFSLCGCVSFEQIYADVKELGEPRPFPIPPRKMFVEATAEELIRRYKYGWCGGSGAASCADETGVRGCERSKLLANEDYASFVNRTPIIGIWDDHDYGINDGGKEYSYREQSQQVFLDFIGEPMDSPRRKQKVRLGCSSIITTA